MDKILLNQKTVNSKKTLKKIQKSSIRGYCKGKSVSKTKIGKLVKLVPSNSKMEDTGHLSSEVNLDRLMELLESSNLTGMSGNGFPVKKKLELFLQNQSLKQSQKILLINGAECEPGLIHDEWILRNHWNEVSKGIQLLGQLIPFERCVLACKITRDEQKKKRDAVGFEVCMVPARYPMGEEHLLIRQVLGRTLAREEHPVEAGILVMNVQTVYQIYCLLTKQYHNGRYITLADLDSGEASVEYITRGEDIREKLVSHFSKDSKQECFAGAGIMSAHAIERDESFADQISFAAIGHPVRISNDAACKGCGMCNRKCPAGVNIKKIVGRRETDSQADISDLGIENCIHCGSCTFFCRAGKNIAEYLNK